MPLIKGKDLPAKRAHFCGDILKPYPIGTEGDLNHWVIVSRTLADDEKWCSQSHMHPDMTEYWFILEGTGQITVGNETYDVEPGDLVITPPFKPHTVRGDITFLCTMAKYNKDGKTYGGKAPVICTDEPYRDEPEKRPKAWEYLEIDPNAPPPE